MTLKRILLPVDFSGRCRGAARYIHALAARCACEVTLLHVLPPPHYEFSSMEAGGAILDELYASRAARVRQELDTYLNDELEQFAPKRVLLEGDAARRIVEYAQEGSFDLVMMPTHGYGVFRRFVLGSITAKVLHDAACPVWTGVHLEEAPSFDAITFSTVAAAIDLGGESCRTLEWATGFATAFGARLVIVHAIPSLEGRTGEYFDPDWKAHLSASAREQIAALRCSTPVPADVVVEDGDPPKVVCGQAADAGAALLVIGRGSAAGVFGRLRANAYSIIRQSPCPVVSV